MTQSAKNIELDPNPLYRAIDERLESAGRWFYPLLMALGLLGGYGSTQPGPAPIEAETPGMEVPRIVRQGTPIAVRLHAAVNAGDNRAGIILPRALLDAVDISSIQPEPARQWSTRNGVSYDFDGDDQASLITVHLQARTRRPGVIDESVQLGAGQAARWKQLVLP